MVKFWAKYDEEMLQEVEQTAKNDAMNGIPHVDDQDVSPYEYVLRDKCQEAVKGDISAFDKKDGAYKERFYEARNVYQNAKKALEGKQQIMGREIMRHYPIWMYLVFAVVIVAGEFPINFEALNVIGTSPWLEGTLALLLGVALMLVAHLIGQAFRQHVGVHWGAVISIILVIGIVAGLGSMRVVYFSAMEEEKQRAAMEEESSASMESSGSAGETPGNQRSQAESPLKRMDPRTLAVIFALMNSLFFLVGIWLASHMHDSDAEYEIIERKYLKAKKIAEGFAQKRQELLATHKENADRIVEFHQSLINIYRQINRSERQDKTSPKIWPARPVEKFISINEVSLNIDNDLKPREQETVAQEEAKQYAA